MCVYISVIKILFATLNYSNKLVLWFSGPSLLLLDIELTTPFLKMEGMQTTRDQQEKIQSSEIVAVVVGRILIGMTLIRLAMVIGMPSKWKQYCIEILYLVVVSVLLLLQCRSVKALHLHLEKEWIMPYLHLSWDNN